MNKSWLHCKRLQYQPKLPLCLQDIAHVETVPQVKYRIEQDIHSFFPSTYDQPFLLLKKGARKSFKKKKVGVIFSGGQAPGGHNVISGLFDALKNMDSNSQLIGFLGGPQGLIDNKSLEITASLMDQYRNTGGFDLLGSGRTKISKDEQFAAVLDTVLAHALDGIIIIGGDDSNTNAALLAEYFLKKNQKISVIGVPKTIDGDLQGECLDISFGFDTATKIYSELIGNIARDARSSLKYYHFIKLMGRSASHITLECALNTRPNLALIGEEIAAKRIGLQEIVEEIADLVMERAAKGKIYGVILIPEGLIEFIPELNALIQEIPRGDLSDQGRKTLEMLPEKIRNQLMLERDSHGNIPLSQIATDELLMHLVKETLKKRPSYQGKFTPLTHFLGYEGRSGFPTNFDATLCYALGHGAALLVQENVTGYMATIYDLKKPYEEWQCGGIPLASMIHLEERGGKRKAVIRKSLVDLKKPPFLAFEKERKRWALEDEYLYPGPIQFTSDGLFPPSIIQLSDG